jgi:hypothetical protein
MSRSRRTAGPLILLFFISAFTLPLSAQDADSTRSAADTVGEELPFAKNAGRYRLRVYPEFCIGFGLSVAAPDMSAFDDRYREGSKPSNHVPLGSLGLKLRYQPLSWLALSLTTEAQVELSFEFDSEDEYNNWLRNAISVTAHQGIHSGGLFSVFGGAGVTRIDYEHSGMYTADETLHITAREFGMHFLGGIELDMVGGPIFSLSAACDVMPEVEGVDLSSYLASFHVLFQF